MTLPQLLLTLFAIGVSHPNIAGMARGLTLGMFPGRDRAEPSRRRYGTSEVAERLDMGPRLSVVASADVRPNVLAVGDVEEWRRRGNTLPMGSSLAFVEICEVTPELIATLAPEMVVSPLLGRGFDCIDLAQALHASGFRGRYRAMARNLPDPQMIRQEIRSLCPGLDFDILELPSQRQLQPV